MRRDDRVRDGQAEARVPGGPGAATAAADEPLEHRLPYSGRHPRPVVGDRDLDHLAAGRCQADLHGRPGGRVRPRVAQQVGQRLVQPVLVTADGDRLVRQVELPPVIAAGDPRVVGRLEHQPGEVHRLVGERPPGVQPGQQQQVIHQVAHPHRLGLHPAQRMTDAVWNRFRAAQGELGVAADPGERGAQLVAGVRGEMPQPVLARLAAGQRPLHVPEHPVERGCELPDLGARVGVRHPVRQLDLAAGQRQLGDRRRGAGHPPQRAERQPHPQRAGDRGDQQCRTEHHQLDLLQPPHGGVDPAQREPGYVHVPVPGERQQPVVAEPGQVARVRLVVAREPGQRGDVGGRQVHGLLADRAVIVGDDAGVGDLPGHEPGSEGAGHLPHRARRVVPVVTGSVVRAGLPALAGLTGLARLVLLAGCAVFQAERVELGGAGQLLVEAAEQEAAQRDRRGDADRGAGEQEKDEDPGDKAGAKGPARQPPPPHPA